MLLDGAVSLFLRSRSLGIYGGRRKARPATLAFYSRELQELVTFMRAQGITAYENMKSKHVENYIASIHERDSWGEASKCKNLRALRAFSRWIERDPECQCEGLRGFHSLLPPIPRTPVRKFVPSRRELRLFMGGVGTKSRSGQRDFTVMHLMLDNGMRIGEAALLTLQHLKLEERTIIVPELGKTGTRLVPITDYTARLLKRWLKRRAEFAKCDFVFVSNRGGPTTPNTYEQSWARYRIKSGQRNITPHTLRHCFCTYFLEDGGDLAKLRAITGHSSYDILGGYLNLCGQALRKELERVNPARQVRSAF